MKTLTKCALALVVLAALAIATEKPNTTLGPFGVERDTIEN